MIVELVADLCRLSLAFHAACNGSPNVMRSNSGQQVYAGHVCWLDTACDESTAFSLFACLLLAQTGHRIRQPRERDNLFMVLTLCTPTLNQQVCADYVVSRMGEIQWGYRATGGCQ